MDKIEYASAVRFIRKMRGGSQPIMVEASDRRLYVVKSQDNLQGRNVLFNEVVGSEMFRQMGLPGPEWALIHLSQRFVDDNPGCWFETAEGFQRRKPGWCFGSRMLGLNGARILEIIPAGYFSRLQNRGDFLKAWVVDALCEHSDHRQALFVEGRTRGLKAFFIDHGHLLGGADGLASPVIWASLYLDRSIYADVCSEFADEAEVSLRWIDLGALSRTVRELPAEWGTPEAQRGLDILGQRFSDSSWLKGTARTLLRLLEGLGRKDEDGHASIPRVRLDDTALCSEVSWLRGRSDAWIRGTCCG